MNAPKDIPVDHIFRDSLDNRKSELRLCTYSENMMNVGMAINNKSGYKGVCWDKHAGKWKAYIGRDRIKFNLGFYNTKEEAFSVRLKAEEKYFGEFGNGTQLANIE
jgi:hypothetical protein